MSETKRKFLRVETHIIAELKSSDEILKHYGYIENLSEEGICVVTLDSFEANEGIIVSFSIPDKAIKLNLQVSLVYSTVREDALYYHGFRFDSLNEEERAAIAVYVQRNN